MNNRKIYCNNVRQPPDNEQKTSMNKLKQVEVELRCVFVKICQVDTVNEHYYADIFLQAKWREPILDNKLDIKTTNLTALWNPKLYIENIFGESKETISLDVIYPDKKGSAFMIEKRRVKGVFHETLELKQFPFDCQDLSVNVSSELSIDEVELIESRDDISKLNATDAADSQEWNLHSHVEVSSRTVKTDCDIGASQRQIVSFTCRASRRFGYFLVNHVLISALLCLLAFCSFAVSPNNTHGRLQLCMIILLTTVTFKVVVSQNLPKISYLTYLDKAVLGNIFIIMCLCIWHAGISIFFHDGAHLTIGGETSVISQNNINSTSVINGSSSEEILMVKKIRQIEKIVIPSMFGLYVLTMLGFGWIIYFDAGSRRKLMHKKDEEFLARAQRSYIARKSFCEPF